MPQEQAKNTVKSRVVVLAINASGAPEFFVCPQTEFSEEDIIDGEHYEKARAAAIDAGYEEPMVAFDDRDPAARQILEGRLARDMAA